MVLYLVIARGFGTPPRGLIHRVVSRAPLASKEESISLYILLNVFGDMAF